MHGASLPPSLRQRPPEGEQHPHFTPARSPFRMHLLSANRLVSTVLAAGTGWTGGQKLGL